ncbi:uncharacterized protein IL334_003777 [Kwoniella shivajii]|uniref:RNA polymerase II subunit B1 CTD phosphatase RPAP2 homolog n=1 Tax=Kwoniella shivajii TaxID=564305 RepID=A0ABZ1D0A4_9TREE|nr:hypothetical protein IL334_003777 [Kwoniella shivajii]
MPVSASTNPSTAGPSATAPRNPVRLSVSQRSSPLPDSSASELTTSAQLSAHERDTTLDNDTLRKAAVRKVKLQRRVNKWTDKLMEETVDKATFRNIASHLTPSQYSSILHERHLNSLCSYPMCNNQPKRPYSTVQRFVISTKARTIKPKEGNPEDGFCGNICKVRSEWIDRNLSEEAVWLRTSIRQIDLLEDLEERGEFRWAGVDRNKVESLPRGMKEDKRKDITRAGAKHDESRQTMTQQAKLNNRPSDPPTPISSIFKSTKVTLPTSMSKAQISDNAISALIANLKIHERPTPSTPPKPPSFAPQSATVPSPQANPLVSTAQPQPQSQTEPKSSSPSNTKRDARHSQSALLGTSTSQLSSTFVAATKSLGPIQPQPDSDEENDKESDWEKEMGWGDENDQEMKVFWEEARLARELLDR